MIMGVVRVISNTMSATAQSTSTASAELSDKARVLATYLEKKAIEEDGVMYIKGKFIADDVGYSAKEIGQLIPQLQDADLPISIEPWSYTGATTWQVSVE